MIQEIFGFVISMTLTIISAIVGYNEWMYIKFIIIISIIAIPLLLTSNPAHFLIKNWVICVKKIA